MWVGVFWGRIYHVYIHICTGRGSQRTHLEGQADVLLVKDGGVHGGGQEFVPGDGAGAVWFGVC